MVSLKDCVVEQFYLKPETGRVVSKNQYFYDVYHPSNVGHTVMADCLLHLLHKVNEADMYEVIRSRMMRIDCDAGSVTKEGHGNWYGVIIGKRERDHTASH